MHLKTILIFCSLCLFTDTMSDGLNALHIQSFQVLTRNFNDNETVKKVFKYFNIDKEYEYNSEDSTYVRAFKMLEFVVGVKKLGHHDYFATLNEYMFKEISTKFHELDLNNDGVIKGSEYMEIVTLYGHFVNRGNLIEDWKKNVNPDYFYELSDVLLDLLQYIANNTNKSYLKIYWICVDIFIENIKKDVSPNDIYAQDGMKLIDFYFGPYNGYSSFTYTPYNK
ncbi:uncharacterized protein LOC126903906 [Daktulosphaira vitifoliae]|uniref:uncharacterized protein LOC126903906 n=1 Tax=Daktulosphaira vitifoliae TaxID=58002 RepID=UPI0021A97B14|nr:uncharacterized protein LOC126903906 [Daktulosphaira vitifoliae]